MPDKLEIKVFITLADSQDCGAEKRVAPHLVWEVSPADWEAETSEGSPRFVLTVQQLACLFLVAARDEPTVGKQWLAVIDS